MNIIAMEHDLDTISRENNQAAAARVSKLSEKGSVNGNPVSRGSAAPEQQQTRPSMGYQPTAS